MKPSTDNVVIKENKATQSKGETVIPTKENGFNGYDYENQAWVKDNKYVACSHPSVMQCNCNGRLWAGRKYHAEGK